MIIILSKINSSHPFNSHKTININLLLILLTKLPNSNPNLIDPTISPHIIAPNNHLFEHPNQQ